MKKSLLSFLVSVLLLGQAYGCGSGGFYEYETDEDRVFQKFLEKTQEMLIKGILTEEELDDLNNENRRILNGFPEAWESGNEEMIRKYRQDFEALLTRWLDLDAMLKAAKS